MPATDPLDAAPSDVTGGATTLLDALGEASKAGFDAQLVVTDDGELRCTRCGTTSPIADFDVVGSRRLEGASDPADMLLVVWGRCSGCGDGGVATVGYGPNATAGDAKFLDELDLGGPA